MWHRLQHLLGWNFGTVETFWIDGELWVGFRCSGCGRIDGAEKSRIKLSGEWMDRSLGRQVTPEELKNFLGAKARAHHD